MIAMRWKLVPYFTMDDDRPVEIKRVLQYREAHKYHWPEGTVEDFNGVEWKDVPEEHDDVSHDIEVTK